jgi:hypothetical protein
MIRVVGKLLIDEQLTVQNLPLEPQIATVAGLRVAGLYQPLRFGLEFIAR